MSGTEEAITGLVGIALMAGAAIYLWGAAGGLLAFGTVCFLCALTNKPPSGVRGTDDE